MVKRYVILDVNPSRQTAFWRSLLRKRDFYAGGLTVLLGLVAVYKGPTYGIGTLTHMGAGFLPTALGALLILLGIAIAGAAISVDEGDAQSALPDQPQWRGWACILAGPVCFIIFGRVGGLIPATFTCVFVSALGDRGATLKSSFVLATVVTVFGVVLFSYLLQVPMAILAWRGL